MDPGLGPCQCHLWRRPSNRLCPWGTLCLKKMKSSRVSVVFYSPLVVPNLKYLVQFLVPDFKKDVYRLQGVHQSSKK